MGLNKETRKGGMSRRIFLGATLGAPVLAAMGELERARARKTEGWSAEDDKAWDFLDNVKKNPKKVETGRLAGRQLNDLYSLYTGLYYGGKTDKVPAGPVEVDFRYQLAELWKAKRDWMKKNAPKDDDKKKEYPDTPASVGRKLFESYNADSIKPSSVREYVKGAQAAIDDVRATVDWDVIKRTFKLSDERLELLREMEATLTGESFAAYTLTELMPSRNGRVNVDVLEFILQHAGEEFLERIPATHDPYVSHGQYQFTHRALREWQEESGERGVGASFMNLLLKEGKIPGRVSELQGAQHHKAAYLFALYNLSRLVRDMEFSITGARKLVPEIKSEIVQFIATAHNKPAGKNESDYVTVHEAFEKFLDARHSATMATQVVTTFEMGLRKKNEKKYKNWRERMRPPSYARVVREEMEDKAAEIYASKTAANYQALIRYLGQGK